MHPIRQSLEQVRSARRRQTPAVTYGVRQSVCQNVVQIYPRMEPSEFCAYWLNASTEDMAARGYRARCVRLMSFALRIPAETIKSWGTGTDFEKAPPLARTALGYFHYLALHREVFSQLQGIGEETSSGKSALDVVDGFIAKGPEAWNGEYETPAS